MKKTVKILALALAAGMLTGIAACADGDTEVSIDSFWYVDTYDGIQNSAIHGDAEKLLYDITCSGNEGNGSYRVEYFTDDSHDHYYETTFGTYQFDWKDSELTHESYRAASTDDDTTEWVYVLTTTMKISGQFVFGGTGTVATSENSVAFENSIETVTYFRSALDDLQPLYSRQTVHTTSPNGMAPASKDDMCRELNYEYEVFYNRSASEATYTYTDNLHPEENFTRTVGGLNDTGYNMFDTNTVYTAVRGMSLSENFGATVSLFTPAQGGAFNVNVSCSGTSELDKENNAQIYGALTETYGTSDLTPAENAEEERSYIYYNSVTITAATELSGTSQTAWFAAVEDEDDNQYRATMLYLAIPMSYGLGTLEYTLTDVESVLGANAASSDVA